MVERVSRSRELVLPVLVIVFLLFFSPPSLGFSSSDCHLSNTITTPDGLELWLNQHTETKVSCSCPYALSTKLVKTSTNTERVSSLNTYSFYRSNKDTGEYKIIAYCGNETAEIPFSVNLLSFSIVSPVEQTEVYQGVGMDIIVDVEKNGQPVDCLYQTSFTVRFRDADGNEIIVNDGQLIKGEDPNTGYCILTIPESQVERLAQNVVYDIEVSATYDTGGGLVSSMPDFKDNILIVKPPLEMKSLRISYYDQSEGVIRLVKSRDTLSMPDLTIVFTPVLESQVITDEISTDNLWATIDGRSLTVKSVEKKSGTEWEAVLSGVPSLSPGNYTLSLGMNYRGYEYETSIPVRYEVLLYTQLVDDRGNPIGANIVFERDDGSTIPVKPVDNKGSYQVSLLPGTYNIVAQFPGVGVCTIKKVKVEEPTPNFLRFRNVPGGAGLGGLTVARFVALSLALPHGEISCELSYDGRKVLDPRNLRVFECSYWNFDASRCLEDWRELNATRNPGANTVSFETDRATAYLVGEVDSLFVDATMDQKKYTAGSTIYLKGKIVNRAGSSVPNITVNYEVPGTGISGSTVTDVGGVFEIEIVAPMSEGNYELVVAPVGDLYASVPSRFPFSVEKIKRIRVVFPESLQVVIGRQENYSFTVENNGQKDVKNIVVSLDGIPDAWYYIEGGTIDHLSPGESRNGRIIFLVTKERCVVDACREYYFAKLRAEGDGVSSTVDVTLHLSEEEPVVARDNATAREAASGGMGDAIESLTGRLTALTTTTPSLEYVVVALAGFGVAVLGARKASTKKKSKKRVHQLKKIV